MRTTLRRANHNARAPLPTVPVTLADGIVSRKQMVVDTEPGPPRVPWSDRPPPTLTLPDPKRAVRAASWAALRALSEVRYGHIHVGNLVLWTYRGTKRGVGLYLNWVFSREYRRLADLKAEAGRADDAQVLLRAVRDNRKGRALIAVGILLGAACLAAIVVSPVTDLWQRAAVLVLWVSFAVPTGRRSPGRIIELPDDTGPVTRDQIGEAFERAGIKGVMSVGAPEYHRGRCVLHVALPKGTPSSEALTRQRAVASGLGYPASCVFLEAPLGAVEGHVTVTVTNTDPMAGDPPPHPLVRARHQDVWTDGVPLGVDPRGLPVNVPLLGSHILVVGAPDAGKSLAIAGIAVGAVRCPDWDIDILEFKGDAFYGPLRPLCGTYITPADIGIDEAGRQTLAYLQDLEAEALARHALLAGLPVEANPLGKVTRDLVASDARFRPRLVVIDEFQNVLELDDGPRILEAVIRAARSVRSLNITLVLGMQRATRKTIEDLRSYLTVRFCLRVKERGDSQLVLDTDHVTDVVDASTIPRDRYGVGFLSGANRPVGLVRDYEMDRRILGNVAGDVLAERRRLGIVQSPGVVLAKPEDRLRSRVAGLFGDHEWILTPRGRWQSSDEVACRLGSGWDARRVGRELRREGVAVGKRSWRESDGTARSVAGVYRDDL